jgi:opacity protein-like surface antigen
LSLEASSAPEADAGDRFDAIPAAVTQIQPWGALSGLSLGYSPSERWEVTLSWSTLGSDVDEDLNAGDELRVLQRVRLTSVILGARYYPLTATRVRPFAALGVGSFEGTETGLTREDGRDWSRGHSALGTQLGAGVDVDLSRRVTFGVRALYNWMGRFDEPIGGRQHYRGTEFRVAASWRFGGGPRL